LFFSAQNVVNSHFEATNMSTVLFYCMVDELADITFNYSLQTLVEAMFESVKEIFQPAEEQMERFINAFISRLPKYMQEAISPSLAA
ncbi:hypothetical protein ACXO9X_09155, partial [Lactobacillus delbrueckii subsp. bulgaricus]